jgi:hypothetical protein
MVNKFTNINTDKLTVNGVDVTDSIGELDALDGMTATVAELNKLSNAPFDASFVIGAESGGNVINVAIQLLDADGNDLATRAAVHFYLSSDAEGDNVVAAATSLAIGTDGVAIEYVSNSAGILISEDDGDIDLNIGDASGAATYYLILILPNGLLKASAVITFA